MTTGISAPPQSALTQGPTGRERLGSHLAKLRPGRGDLIDAAFAAVVTAIALVGFRTTFFGVGWIIAGAAGLVLGLLVTHFWTAFRAPAVAIALALAATYFAFGGLFVRQGLIAGFIPGGETISTLAHQATSGWKELMTALPPVDASGPYLALPFLLGLVGSALAYGVARTWRSPLVTLVVPLGLLAFSIAIGTLDPASVGLQGGLFALVALTWAASRAARNRPALQNGSGAVARGITALVLLGLACAGGLVVGPKLVQDSGANRNVWRTQLVPPFDVSAFPSPLAGFRKYTEPNPNALFDKPLLTVQGLPDGTPLRFATLVSYDGQVWGAGNAVVGRDLTDASTGGAGLDTSGFRVVGSHIATRGVGTQVQGTVTIAQGGYADVWLPVPGELAQLEFGGPRAAALKEELRYNIDTSTGVLPGGLQAGDSYQLTAILPTLPDPSTAAFASGSLVDGSHTGFLDAKIDTWAGRVPGQWAQIKAVTAQLKDGAYTDGGKPGQFENYFLPGHGVVRLSQFVKLQQLAGNDEQYAATLALMINRLGMPARVVLGAIPEGGTVKGKDVHAWVEVQLDNGQWLPILPKDFLPARDRKPNQVQQKSEQQKQGAQVPPPAQNNPPSVLQGPDQSQTANQAPRKPKKESDNPLNPENWPAWVRWVAVGVGGPLLIALFFYAAARMAKLIRRRRRRTSREIPRRVSGGWHEVIDQASDLKLPVPAMATRREQALALATAAASSASGGGANAAEGAVSSPGMSGVVGSDAGREQAGHTLPLRTLTPLAEQADQHAFSGAEPTNADLAAYWADVATARKDLRKHATFWRRLRGDLSLATFRAHRRVRKAEQRLAASDAAERAASKGPGTGGKTKNAKRAKAPRSRARRTKD